MKRSIDDLRPDPRNPRTIRASAFEALGVSIGEFGDLSGIVFNEKTGNLVTGHQRMKTLVGAGAKSWERDGNSGFVEHPKTHERFPVRIVSWTRSREAAANVAANHQGLAGDFTADLPGVLDEARIEFPELYEALHFDDLRVDFGEDTVTEDTPPEPPKKPVSKPGDLWLLGGHRILCGDATKAEDATRLMDGERAVLMATDPPYGIAYDNSKRPKPGVAKPRVANDEITDGPKMQVFLEAMLKASLLAMDVRAAYYFWHPMLTQGTYVAAAAAAAGILIHRQIIWVKPGLLLGRGDYHWRHELCFYGWRQGSRCPFYGPRNQDTIWEVGSVTTAERREMGHATPKPVALWEKPIRNHTRKGEIVYEPFSGSGTQIVAAEQLGRRCYAIEIDPAFVDVAILRWQRLTGKLAVHAETRKPFRETAGA